LLHFLLAHRASIGDNPALSDSGGASTGSKTQVRRERKQQGHTQNGLTQAKSEAKSG
jgi:hypothetical protein